MSFGEIFAADQGLGPYFERCADTLFSRNIVLLLTAKPGIDLELGSAEDWQEFETRYLRSGNTGETDRARAEMLADTLGIAFGNFVRLLDDIVASTLSAVRCDLRMLSPAAQLLRLYEPGEAYALIPASAGEDAFIKPRRGWPWKAPLAVGTDNEAELAVTPALFPRFILNVPEPLFGRDREEFEAHADFEPDATSWAQFRNLATVQPWIKLDLAGLSGNFWEDEERVALVLRFRNPLHLETDPTENPPYHFNRENFLDAYLDSEDRVLMRGKLSLRARVRQEQRRALVQFREDRPDLSAGGRIVRSEWERRIQSEYFGDTMPSLDQLSAIARFGYTGGAPLPEARRLLQKLIDLGLHDRRNNLYLTHDLTIYQERRRTNLQLDTLLDVRQRLANWEQLAGTMNPVPPNLDRLITHVRAQVSRLTDVAAILVKYGFRRMISAEAILISQDRWCVYEPGAYAAGQWPTGFDQPGERGRGIRIEAELDQNSSDQVQLSIEAIQALIDQGTGDIPALIREKGIVKAFQDDLLADVKSTVELQRDRLAGSGYTEISGMPFSKNAVAQAFIAHGQGGFRRGHRYWI
ncbi:hypothetical protein CLG96_12860 [Sphingomonas oleivorans]|uniref:Uncharacterized protein n=1 Tax=Sphingomonas oleivorans TaxID=1735121 RepID=A0A2T5FW69_9SPHN|nr:hypothetical protein [Sphingomonas oleivorans]PTQ10028.1 hypothetical protein CLG96_12860 [Sphingomonas oleivorans]